MNSTPRCSGQAGGPTWSGLPAHGSARSASTGPSQTARPDENRCPTNPGPCSTLPDEHSPLHPRPRACAPRRLDARDASRVPHRADPIAQCRRRLPGDRPELADRVSPARTAGRRGVRRGVGRRACRPRPVAPGRQPRDRRRRHADHLSRPKGRRAPPLRQPAGDVPAQHPRSGPLRQGARPRSGGIYRPRRRPRPGARGAQGEPVRRRCGPCRKRFPRGRSTHFLTFHHNDARP